jgi:thioredoxin 1
MGNVFDVDVSSFEKEVLRSDKLTLLEFWHEKCPWCAKLAPILDEVSEEYKDKVRFVRLNILANPYNKELTSHLGVMSTPTLVFFCKGKALQGISGFMTKIQLEKTVNDMLQRYRECMEQSTEIKDDSDKFYA